MRNRLFGPCLVPAQARRAFWLTVIVLAAAGPPAAAGEKISRETLIQPALRGGSGPARVLVIDQEGATRPAFVLFMEGFRRALRGAAAGPFDVFVENLDLARLKRDTRNVEQAAGWLREKYGALRFDVIVPTSLVSRTFVLANRQEFSPGARIVGVDRPGTPPPAAVDLPHYASVRTMSPMTETVMNAMRLFPDAKRLAYIGQTEPHPRYAALMEQEARAAAEQKNLEFLPIVDFAVTDLLAAVSRLPPDSLIVYLGHWGDDESGDAVPAELLETICGATSAPVFGLSDSYVGHGIVGGACADLAAIGEATGRLVAATPDEPSPEPVIVPLTNVFDDRALKRFGIPRSRLPAGSRVQFQTPSFWERYWLEAVGITGLVAAQAVLIASLVVNLRRRVAAEQLVSSQRDLVIHAGRVSTLGEFAASLAHELGQPLGAILNNVEAAEMLLQKSTLDDAGRTELRSIIADIAADERRAGDVLDRIRTMVRRQRFERSPVKAPALIKGVQALVGSRCATEGISLQVDCHAAVAPIAGDSVLLQQALLNLVSNAVDAICRRPSPDRKPGIISLRCREVAEEIEIEISDDGGGMVNKDVAWACEPFHSTKEDGLGVGLAIVQSIMEQHEGRLILENEPGRGLTARLRLPIWHAESSS
jgi:signal transduction histidine kinase